MKEKLKNSFILFWTFLKIGLFTFGGGYGMIGIIQDQCVERRHWIKQDEFFEIIVIAESTPGPIAVNMATYIGYKVSKFLGALFATIGLAIPSLIIIFVISLFYEQFMELEIIKSAFAGLQVGVFVLLTTTIIKLSKQINKNLYFYIAFATALALMLIFKIFVPGFGYISIILIALGLLCGVFNTALANRLKKDKKEDKK